MTEPRRAVRSHNPTSPEPFLGSRLSPAEGIRLFSKYLIFHLGFDHRILDARAALLGRCPDLNRAGEIQDELDHGVSITTSVFAVGSGGVYRKGAITILLRDGAAIVELMLECGSV